MVRPKFISVQSATYTKDATGGTRATYAAYWQGWCHLEEMNFKQAMESGQPTGNQSVKIELRKNDKTELITDKMRLIYRNNNYNITGIRELDPFKLEIIASRKVL